MCLKNVEGRSCKRGEGDCDSDAECAAVSFKIKKLIERNSCFVSALGFSNKLLKIIMITFLKNVMICSSFYRV